ncbi:MAG: rod shape-determining protein MreD [Candidatus Omnitrophica bacterium]|nr:rod shape-determining protein MreD [Candidatus Omnitrophota bacterium]
MRQVLVIPVICYLALLGEFVLFNIFGRWGDPHLLLLVVIFFNLYSGIRFCLWAALWAGAFQDCFSTMPFGTHIFAYVACAYLSTFIRRTYYERGSDVSKLLMVFMVVTAHAFILGLVHQMVFCEVRWIEVWFDIWIPEMVTTVAVALYIFGKLLGVARALKF